MFHAAPVETIAVSPFSRRLEHRAAVSASLGQYADFLGDAGERDPRVRELSRAAAERLTAELPERMPLALGHGDFTAQNVFAAPAGRVTVFDPMPLWQVPIYEDIARFTIGIRLFTEQTLTQGLALSSEHLDLCERSFLRGYFGPAALPAAVVHGFQALLLLDRWAALISKQGRGRGPRRILHEARVRATSRYYRGQAGRLLAMLYR